MNRALTAVAVVLALLATAACDRDQNDPEPIAACDLLTRGETRDVLGGEVNAPESTQGGADALAGRSGCAWSTADGRKAILVELVRTADMSDSVRRTGFSASARFDAARSRHPDAAPVAIGDDAIWVEESARLHVLAGDDYLTAEVAVPRPADARPIAAEFARRAVVRLTPPGGQTDGDE
ncbi:MAG TPA: hypothetical protein VF230_19370 [Acidimicrobiales bacterium]